MQRMINFDDICVILVNDGEGNEIPSECFREYPFGILQMTIPKGGVSRARNAGLDHSTADWVMFCDFDDGFSSVYGLYMIMSVINDNSADTLWSSFTEESKDRDGNLTLVAHDRNWVFIHGKAHRRQYLIDNGIRFDDRLTIHEDAYFTILTQSLADENRIAAIKTPIYVWKWNDNSVVRRGGEEDYVLVTYDHLIRQRIALTDEFIRRKRFDLAITTIVKTVMDCYYDCQQFTWRKPENDELLRNVENWFATYFIRYAGYYGKASSEVLKTIMCASREGAIEKGTFLLEQETLKEWFDRVLDNAEPIPEEQVGV